MPRSKKRYKKRPKTKRVKTAKKRSNKKTKTNSKKEFRKDNCNSANKFGSNKLPYTCYDKTTLIQIKDLWNKRHPDEKINSTNPWIIWKSLKNNMGSLCESEKCWLRQKFIKKKLPRNLMNKIFAPDVPKSWTKNPREWLSSVDISAVMKQYENSFKNFMFLGPTPIDFDKKLDEGYVWDEIHNFDLEKSIKKGKTKFGFIFNTDAHDKDGTHWIALYLDIYNKTQPYISYFDSNGIEIPHEIKVLVDRIIDQAKSLNINLKFMQNHPLSHQNKDGECGIYTIYFITQLLQNIKPINYFNTVKIPDNIMSNFRKIFFNI